MRSCGYAFEHKTNNEQSFVRRVTGYDYPRFHAYIHTKQNYTLHTKSYKLIINLHIDQKKPTYGSHTAHSGEYDGELVSAELERIKRLAAPSNQTLAK